ncbi:MAG: hypothetical protein VYC67_00750 [Pseudomonadota bacterium]|nr:hypothetical protein [Pseudomonadota bacterium]
MRKQYLLSLLICLCFNANINALVQSENTLEVISPVESSETPIEITVQEFADLLEMKYEDFLSLLAAAEIETPNSDDIISENQQMQLLKFLQNLSNTNKELKPDDCRPDEMLFCQSERRVKDGRQGRNSDSDKVLCQCGPIPF